MKSANLSFARSIATSVLCLALTSVSGCGPAGLETVEVSGKIVQDGEPLPNGTITFVAKDGSVGPGGGVIKDGAYTAQAPPGDKWVMVLATKVVGQAPMYEGSPGSPMVDQTELLTSPVYNAAHQTPLEANIDGPKEDLNFELTKDVKPRG